MNDIADLARIRPAPRRRDAEATRVAILEAGQAHFARLGYDRAVLRDIAGDAGVDVALIKRYFGGKEALFVEALKASFQPDAMQGWDHATFPRELATMMADSPHVHEDRTQRFQFLLRAAPSPTTASMLNVILQDRFLAPIREWLGGVHAQARARALAATYIGFLVERLVRGEALQGRERDAFIERVTAIFASLVSRDDGQG